MNRFIIALTAALLMAIPALGEVLVIPENTRVIEAEAFRGDTSLDRVALPEGVTTIGERAFEDSTLRMINLPASLTFIADTALPEGVYVYAEAETYAREWAMAKGYIDQNEAPHRDFEIQEGVITAYHGPGGSVGVPRYTRAWEPITAVGEEAFAYLDALQEVTLPDTVREIGDRAFWGCTHLTKAALPGAAAVGDGAFGYCSGLSQVTLATGLEAIGSEAFLGCGALEGIELPETVTEIGVDAFRDCAALEAVALPGRLNALGSGAFAYCGALKEVALPETLTDIGAGAFEECASLTAIAIPSGVEAIASRTFSGCSKLADVVLGEGLTAIGSNAFAFCTGLKQLTLPATVTDIAPRAFWMCDGLTLMGAAGSAAQAWAEANGYPFIPG